MNHSDVKNHLADYLEGDLALEDRALVDAHLGQCEDCAREVAEMEQTIQLLRTLPEPETPPMIAADVMRRIRAGESRPGFLSRLGQGLSGIFEPSFVLPASAIAAAAAVIIVVQNPAGISLDVFAPVETQTSTSPQPILAASPSTLGVMRDSESDRETAPRSPSRYLAEAAARAPASSPSASPRTVITITQQRRTAPSTSLSPSTPSTQLSRIVGRAGQARPDGFAGNVMAAGPPPRFVLDQSSGGASMVAGRPQAMAVAAPVRRDSIRSFAATSTSLAPDGVSSGGEDPRDAWLAAGLENPVDFARFLVNKTLAEQELWVSRLAARAEARGLFEELVATLEAAGDVDAMALAADFVAESSAHAEGTRGGTPISADRTNETTPR